MFKREIMLYNNQKQRELFHLHDPQKANSSDCNPLSGLKEFECDKSYVLADASPEFNCIGWAVGVKELLPPEKVINKHYSSKSFLGDIIYDANGEIKVLYRLHNYEKNVTDCKISVTNFFNEYRDLSILPNKNSYTAVESVSNPPIDDTIAFYFKAGKETVDQNDIRYKGFLHAARYVEDVHSWVSDVWISKFGQYKLMTHDKYELIGDAYGDILCYLIPISNYVDEL